MNRPSLLLIGGAHRSLAAFVAFSALFTVHQTQQALILQFGNPIRVEREPGLKVKVPFIQNVEFFEKRILDLDPPVQEVLLSDQKRINVDAFARYRIVDPLEFKKRAVTIAAFQQIFGGRMNSIIRTEVARVSLADMLSQNRAVIMGKIADELRRQAPDFGVEVIDVRLGRTDLPDATSQAVYNRMRSARVAQAAQLRAQGEQLKATIQAEADRERTIIIAEATRQSQTLRGEGDAAAHPGAERRLRPGSRVLRLLPLARGLRRARRRGPDAGADAGFRLLPVLPPGERPGLGRGEVAVATQA